MTITYTWKVESLDVMPTKTIGAEEFSDVVSRVHWRLIGVGEDGVTAEVYGDVLLDTTTVDPETFVAFDDLTPSKVVDWAVELINRSEEESVEHFKSLVADQIGRKRTPISVTRTLSESVVADSDI